ncbi:hypothetical protein [Alkaliphilus metalliredigens]|uniref:hypothetical protein n=1 Tax=Alkaliphilus metalliredigens TaxID=208226 RepID=UPI001A9A08A0|nr:hypothetical protein [Alkaliphilus metalliredigens]
MGNSTLLISLCIAYFMVGAVYIEYGGEYIEYKSDEKIEVAIGTKINYGFNYRNKMKVPTTLIKVIPVGGEGVELTELSTRETENSYISTTMSFTTRDKNIKLPTKTIIIQRTLGVIPIISIRQNELVGE